VRDSGLDPLYLANEGRFIAFVPERDAERALVIMRTCSVSRGAAEIGRVLDGPPGMVTMRNRLGTERIIDMLSGEQLPRIC
jgi:hydrogenase expression/formation protein HypE